MILKRLTSTLMVFVWCCAIGHCIAENFHSESAGITAHHEKQLVAHHHHCEEEESTGTESPEPAPCDTEVRTPLPGGPKVFETVILPTDYFSTLLASLSTRIPAEDLLLARAPVQTAEVRTARREHLLFSLRAPNAPPLV